ncbi:hypothetical protein CLD22_26990, partial [Rubrivivax gelatinosus]|nr:hypothetical protein [Rubrivivax gelatinosus]
MAETDKDTETWLKRMSLATVIFAVSATLSTFKGGSYSTQSVINQALASDQWSFYQAKSMKQHLFELQAEQLRLQLEALPAANPARADYEKHIGELQSQIDRYGREKH